MKNLKMFVIFASLLFANAILAQNEQKFSEETKKEMKAQFDNVKQKLSLTAEQETKFLEISKSFMQEVKTVRESDLGKKEKLKKVKELQNNMNNKVKEILYEDQYKKYL